MWSDEYISKQLLELHLNLEVDLASRSLESIERTIDFILKECNDQEMDILELGCGPGLYLERLARKGHKVTGVDISQNSILYAIDEAKRQGLDVSYECGDYLELDHENQFDLILLIYTDFGVLIPDDRSVVLGNIYKALKPGGTFIFDVINEKNIDEKFQEQQTWSLEKSGFWRPYPYLELASGYNYPEDKVFLQQHAIINEMGETDIYRFWTHYFTSSQILELLSKFGFEKPAAHEHVLPATSIWNGENVTFYSARKKP